MSRLSNEQKKALAERMFINDGDTADEIAEALQVGKSTVQRWAQKGNWKERRDELLATPHRIKEFIQLQMSAIVEGDENTKIDTKKADMLIKLASAFEKVDKKINVHTVVSVFKEFNNYLIEVDVEFAAKLTKYERDFVTYKANVVS